MTEASLSVGGIVVVIARDPRVLHPQTAAIGEVLVGAADALPGEDRKYYGFYRTPDINDTISDSTLPGGPAHIWRPPSASRWKARSIASAIIPPVRSTSCPILLGGTLR